MKFTALVCMRKAQFPISVRSLYFKSEVQMQAHGTKKGILHKVQVARLSAQFRSLHDIGPRKSYYNSVKRRKIFKIK